MSKASLGINIGSGDKLFVFTGLSLKPNLLQQLGVSLKDLMVSLQSNISSGKGEVQEPNNFDIRKSYHCVLA